MSGPPRGAVMSHRLAVLTMIVVALLWSIAGIVTLQLDSVRSFEMTFWRSLFNAAALLVLLPCLRGPRAFAHSLRHGGRVLWLSGVCWSVMFTAFMLALTLTTVANVLVTMAIAPLLTAVIAWRVLGSRLPRRTWATVVVAGAGITWMYAREVASADVGQLLGTVVALCVPVAAAVNWTLLQASRAGADRDLLPAVAIGAMLSALVTLPLAWPLQASAHDMSWLALLGVAQLAIPCVLSVMAARTLTAPEISLLALLEIIFGVTWPWLAGQEVPAPHVLMGGSLVVGALALNEAAALRRSRLVDLTPHAIPTPATIEAAPGFGLPGAEPPLR